jgi:hypothetical protein
MKQIVVPQETEETRTLRERWMKSILSLIVIAVGIFHFQWTPVDLGQALGVIMVIWCAFSSARKAQRMGRDYWLHLLFGFLLGPVWLLTLHIIEKRKSKVKKCEFCKEQILIDAIFCKHCHKDQPTIEADHKIENKTLIEEL